MRACQTYRNASDDGRGGQPDRRPAVLAQSDEGIKVDALVAKDVDLVDDEEADLLAPQRELRLFGRFPLLGVRHECC